MRIIAGRLKGRSLHVPRSATFRPTTDRVKESVFNILAGYVDWGDVSVCDLYAGSGGLGLEALSRGAGQVTFVERSKASLVTLERNIETLGVSAQASIIRMPVEKFLRQRTIKFSLVFADPPYADAFLDELNVHIAPVLQPGGVAVVEHAGDRTLEPTSHLEVIDRRDYGTTSVTFFRPTDGESA